MNVPSVLHLIELLLIDHFVLVIYICLHGSVCVFLFFGNYINYSEYNFTFLCVRKVFRNEFIYVV